MQWCGCRDKFSLNIFSMNKIDPVSHTAKQAIHPVHTVRLSEILARPLDEWKDRLKNDFEDSVFSKYPAIRELKDKLYSLGAMYASMSGSGATVFGIFKSEFNVASEFRDATVWASYL